jgi:hypothetical protein
MRDIWRDDKENSNKKFRVKVIHRSKIASLYLKGLTLARDPF